MKNGKQMPSPSIAAGTIPTSYLDKQMTYLRHLIIQRKNVNVKRISKLSDQKYVIRLCFTLTISLWKRKNFGVVIFLI